MVWCVEWYMVVCCSMIYGMVCSMIIEYVMCGTHDHLQKVIITLTFTWYARHCIQGNCDIWYIQNHIGRICKFRLPRIHSGQWSYPSENYRRYSLHRTRVCVFMHTMGSKLHVMCSFAVSMVTWASCDHLEKISSLPLLVQISWSRSQGSITWAWYVQWSCNPILIATYSLSGEPSDELCHCYCYLNATSGYTGEWERGRGKMLTILINSS